MHVFTLELIFFDCELLDSEKNTHELTSQLQNDSTKNVCASKMNEIKMLKKTISIGKEEITIDETEWD